MSTISSTYRRGGLARELGQSILVLALTGSSVGGILGMIALVTRAVGRI